MGKNIPKGEASSDMMRRLAADPEYVVRRAEQERQRARRLQKLRDEQRQLLAELREAGIEAELVSDLLSVRSYPRAIPILVRHLSLPYSDPTREAIARALATPEARYAWPNLVAEYRKAPVAQNATSKDGLAVALSATATRERLPELIELLRDKSQGRTRVLLLGPLKRYKTEIARAAIEELEADPELAKEIGSWK